MTRPAALLLAAALALGACGLTGPGGPSRTPTRDADQLDRALTGLLQSCEAAADRPACEAANRPGLLRIAREAQALAAQSPANQDKDRAHRLALAGRAALASGDPDEGYGIAAAAAQQGAELCARPPREGGIHGPRDCAELFALRGYAENLAFFPRLARLRAELQAIRDQPGPLPERAARLRARAEAAGSAEAPGLPGLVDPWFDNVWRPLAASWAPICRLPALSPQTVAALLAQQRRIARNHDEILNASQHLRGGTLALNEGHCRAMAEGGEPLGGRVDPLRLRAWCHARTIETELPADAAAACAGR